MDEYQHFERLDASNDFEGGQWIAGEFVYTKRKRGKQQTEDDRLYGVFQGSSDEEEGFGKRKSGKRGGSSRSLHKEVAFVSSGVVTNTMETVKDEAPAEDTKPDVERLQAAASPAVEATARPSAAPGLGVDYRGGASSDEDDDSADGDAAAPKSTAQASTAQMLQRSAEQIRRQEAEARETEDRRKAMLKQDPSLAKFEQHNRGIGSKLLKMMGWKPGEGLGANRDGISKPVEAALRPKLAGLGAMGEEPAVVAAPKAASVAGPKKADSAFKKAWQTRSRKRAPEEEIKTAEQVLADGAAAAERGVFSLGAAAPAMTILDMTGPQSRVVKDMQELVGAGADREAEEHAAGPFPELQHNLKLLVDIAEGDIRRCDAHARQEADTAIAMQADVDKLASQLEEADAALQRATQVLEAIQVVEQRLQVQPVPPDELQVIYSTLKEEFPTEYELFNCAAIALSELQGPLTEAMATWSPLEAPTQWLPTFMALKPLLSKPTDPLSSAAAYDDDADAPHAHHESSLQHARQQDPFVELVWSAVMPPLRRAVMMFWDATAPGAVLTFFDHWMPLLPQQAGGQLLRLLVLPKLRGAVDAWDPGAAAAGVVAPMDRWLHPWLPHLAADMADLFPVIKTKIVASLQNWQVWEPTANAVLTPWRQVWRPADWRAVTEGFVVPRLQAAMSAMLSLNPLHADTRPCDWALAWAPVLSVQQLAGMYESSFCPQLHSVLHTWLTHDSVLHDEVWAWFENVKRSHLNPELLTEPRIQHHMAVAFSAIHQSQAGLPLPIGYPAVPTLAAVEGAAAAQASSAPGGLSAEDVAAVEAMSIKDFLAERAEEAGLAFVPRGRRVAGLEVYALGKLSVVVDVHSGVVKAFINSRWVPTGIEEAVAQALKQPA